MIYDGNIPDALALYTRELDAVGRTEWMGNLGDDQVSLVRTWVDTPDMNGQIHTATPIEVGIEIHIARPVEGLVLGFRLMSQYDTELAYVLYDDGDPLVSPPTLPVGHLVKRFLIPPNTLASGTYRVQFDVGIHNVKRIVDGSMGSLAFTLENVAGIGRRFLVKNVRGHESLFRPDWKVY